MFETPAISRRQIAPGLHLRFWSCNLSATKIASSYCDKNRLCKRALTRPCLSITMIRFVVEKLRFCKFVGLSSSSCSVLFHIDHLRQESFLYVKGNQGGDESRPSTLSWRSLHISLHFFSVIFLHTQQSIRSESQLACFVLFLNYNFFFLFPPNQWHTP